MFISYYDLVQVSHAELDSASLTKHITIGKTLNQVQGDVFKSNYDLVQVSHAELDSASLSTNFIISETLNQVQGDVFIILDLINGFTFYFLS